jgi:hypothetical protein
MKVKSENAKQPMKASMLPGSTKGNAGGSGASDMAKSMLPGAFVSMTAGADPEDWSVVKAGPAGDESATNAQMGDGQKKRTVTGRDESPYDVK